MSGFNSADPPSFTERIYSVLLRLCPRDFRLEYGNALWQLVRDQLKDEQPAGVSERVTFWTTVFGDLVRTVTLERLEQSMSTTSLIRYSGLLAIIGGLMWAGGITVVAVASGGVDGIEPILLISSVAFAGCLAAIAVQGGYATPRLATTGAVFGGLGALSFFVGMLSGVWLLFVIGFYGLMIGSVLTGLGMLSLQRVLRSSSGALVFTSALLILFNDTNWQAWFAVPFGLAWIAVGYVLITSSNDQLLLVP